MFSDRTGPVTADEIAEWNRYYSARPWIGEAMRLTRRITLSQEDSRRLYELAGAIRRKDKPATVALAAHLMASGVINKNVLEQLLSGEIE